jgi:hypothetical protein
LRRYGGKWAKNRQIMRKCCLKFTFFAGQCLDWRNAAFIQTFLRRESRRGEKDVRIISL